MARRIDVGEDSALNMTPMIDVCFQLIVFFMLTLRFKSIDRRIEAEMPKHLGPSSDVAKLDPLQPIAVRLWRKNVDGPAEQQFTRVRVGERLTVDLPAGRWPAEGAAADVRLATEDALLARVGEAITAAWEAQGRDVGVRGVLRTPSPDGDLVPHGDVMRVLDTFLTAGLTNVAFEGARSPEPSAAGGGWEFR